MAAQKGEKAAEKGETAVEKGEMAVKPVDEEKGSSAAKKGGTGVKAADEENGATEKRKGAMAVEKGEEGATFADEEKEAAAEGKGKKRQAGAAAAKMIELESSEGKLSEEAVWKLSEEAEWKWKIATAADEEGPEPRREPTAVVDKELEATAAAKELGGEKSIFFSPAAGKMVDLESSESEGKLSEEAVRKLSEEAEWKWKIAAPGECPKPRRERRRWRSTRREPGAAADKVEEATAAAKEVAGEKAIFFFSAAAVGKTINLVSSEGKLFKMSEEAARLSVILADMIDNGCAGGYIPLTNVDARALATVIKHCDKHAAAAKPNSDSDRGAADGGVGSSSVNTPASEKPLAEWDRKLVDNLTQDALYDLIVAANFLDIKGLLEATCQKVADMIKGKTPAQVRSIFQIANDFTAEEEAEIRKENSWAFEDEDP